MILRWFISGTVRDAVALHRHVRKLLASQRDILAPDKVADLNQALAKLKTTLGQGTDKVTLLAEMKLLEDAANRLLRPYPNPTLRENIEVFLVAIGVAMAVRTFFLQPFKIPTGSMQPTLYGVTPTPEASATNDPSVQPPNWFRQRWDYWVHGCSYFIVKAPENGVLQQIRPPVKLLLFNLKQDYVFNGRIYTIWFPADDLFQRVGIFTDRETGTPCRVTMNEFKMPAPVALKEFAAGEDIIRLKVIAGDHLFVNRLSYNFRHPERGDIVVFKTKGTNIRDQNTYYIKRLVGLPGETLSLKPVAQVRHLPPGLNLDSAGLGTLVINGKDLDRHAPGFEEVYSFNGASTNEVLDYRKNLYYGHALLWRLSLGSEYHVGTNNLFVMGDNTLNSSDSRDWGDFPRQNIIGKAGFVYWPISIRFGYGYR